MTNRRSKTGVIAHRGPNIKHGSVRQVTANHAIRVQRKFPSKHGISITPASLVIVEWPFPYDCSCMLHYTGGHWCVKYIDKACHHHKNLETIWQEY